MLSWLGWDTAEGVGGKGVVRRSLVGAAVGDFNGTMATPLNKLSRRRLNSSPEKYAMQIS